MHWMSDIICSGVYVTFLNSLFSSVVMGSTLSEGAEDLSIEIVSKTDPR